MERAMKWMMPKTTKPSGTASHVAREISNAMANSVKLRRPYFFTIAIVSLSFILL